MIVLLELIYDFINWAIETRISGDQNDLNEMLKLNEEIFGKEIDIYDSIWKDEFPISNADRNYIIKKYNILSLEERPVKSISEDIKKGVMGYTFINNVLNPNIINSSINEDTITNNYNFNENYNLNLDVSETEKRAQFVKNLDIVYCDHNAYMLLNEDYRRAKIMLNSTALINAGFMTWNDVLINLNNKEVHEKIAEFMHNYLERNNGEFKNGFVLELYDYIISLGFSDKYVQMLVRQFIKDFKST